MASSEGRKHELSMKAHLFMGNGHRLSQLRGILVSLQIMENEKWISIYLFIFQIYRKTLFMDKQKFKKNLRYNKKEKLSKIKNLKGIEIG